MPEVLLRAAIRVSAVWPDVVAVSALPIAVEDRTGYQRTSFKRAELHIVGAAGSSLTDHRAARFPPHNSQWPHLADFLMI
ncbi:hypothetical protein ABZY81_39165 [Streptomyces sp. NPDC006514]|uniref:hypothetical protein n=1 Tax=Streptomyces sp. NPDC006514 TaxID=3154308 RepID=UPI0033B861E1